jgi:hypothetical protein
MISENVCQLSGTIPVFSFSGKYEHIEKKIMPHGSESKLPMNGIGWTALVLEVNQKVC